jgi:hypothetical protein
MVRWDVGRRKLDPSSLSITRKANNTESGDFYGVATN